MRSHLNLLFGFTMIIVAACSSTSGGSDAGAGHGGTGTGGNTGTDGGMTCSPACGSGSVCVASGVSGGAIVTVNDAGVCPTGYHPTNGGRCTQDLTYTCKPIPAACGGTVSCACASSLCTNMCDGYANGVLSCIELVP